jgi:hypothetical protein
VANLRPAVKDNEGMLVISLIWSAQKIPATKMTGSCRIMPTYGPDLKKLICHKNGAESLVLAIWANKSKMYLEQPKLFVVAISSILLVLGHGRPEFKQEWAPDEFVFEGAL